MSHTWAQMASKDLCHCFKQGRWLRIGWNPNLLKWDYVLLCWWVQNVSFPITPEQSASAGCLVRTSVQQRVIDQVNVASQGLSLPAFLCPRQGVCSTIQLSESLFQATIVFWVLNVNARVTDVIGTSSLSQRTGRLLLLIMQFPRSDSLW